MLFSTRHACVAVFTVALFCLLGGTGLEQASAQGSRMLRSPTVSSTHIAFVNANDIWVVGRDGGDARRLTSATGRRDLARFLPRRPVDRLHRRSTRGTPTCTSCPAAGGRAAASDLASRGRRGPGMDAGGQASSSSRAGRGTRRASTKFFTVPVRGGFPTALPIPRANSGEMSGDGRCWPTRRSGTGIRSGGTTGEGRLSPSRWCASRASSGRRHPGRASGRWTRCGWTASSTTCRSGTGPANVWSWDPRTGEENAAHLPRRFRREEPGRRSRRRGLRAGRIPARAGSRRPAPPASS